MISTWTTVKLYHYSIWCHYVDIFWASNYWILRSFTHHLPIIYRSFTYRLPIIYPSFTYRLPMIYLSFTYHLPIIYRSFTYHLPIVYLSFTYHLPIIYLSFTYRLPIVYLLFFLKLQSWTLTAILRAPPISTRKKARPQENWIHGDCFQKNIYFSIEIYVYIIYNVYVYIMYIYNVHIYVSPAKCVFNQIL